MQIIGYKSESHASTVIAKNGVRESLGDLEEGGQSSGGLLRNQNYNLSDIIQFTTCTSAKSNVNM